MNVFSLFASLKLDKSDYEKNIKDAKKEGEDFAEDTEKKVSPMAVAGWAAIAAAVVKVTKEIVKLATESMNYADKVSDLAAQYGVSTDAISEMQYIAEQSSTSVEGLTSAMRMLYSRAKEDGEAFQQLGISVKDTNGNFKTMDELFWDTTGALNSIENEGEKSAVMLDLFGRNAMSVGEVLRKSTSEINAMRQEAHDLGIVMSEETVKMASDFNDKMAVIKMQRQSALASLIAGAPDAEERLQQYFDNVLEMIEKYIPAFVKFAVRLITQAAIALVKIAPQLAIDIVNEIQNTILNMDWFQFGIEIGKSLINGVINIFLSGFRGLFKLFGVEIPTVDIFGDRQNNTTFENLQRKEQNYEIQQKMKQEITVKVEASGDTAVSKESAEKTAEALAPYIDKILGSR